MAEREVESKSMFPFNGYDIFGYIIPGGVFFLTVFIFDFWAKDSMNFEHNPMITLIGLFKPINQGSPLNTFDSIVFILSAILVIYVIGHIVAAISSFFIDRILIKKGHHYPIKSILLKVRKNTDGSKSIKGNFVVFNLVLLVLHISSCIYLAIAYSVYTHDYIYWHLFLLITIIIGLLSLVAMFSYSFILPFLKPFYFIYDFSLSRLREVIGTDGGISREVKKKYKRFLREELKLKRSNLTTDVYWLSYIYISRKSPLAVKALTNWMHLYSFSRNLATSFYIAFIYCVSSIGLNSHMLNGVSYNEVSKYKIFIGLVLPLTYWVLSILFLLRFYYLYHGYYSKFIIRTCAFLYEQSKKNV
tara:strand:- start:8037 stop:9113 length:1077 start_codon:yes stop_codon:yes gene_type:complete